VCPPEESSTQQLASQAAPTTRVNKPSVHNVVARLTRLEIYFPTLKRYDRLYGLWVYCLRKAILRVCPYFIKLLAAMFNSLSNILCKHMFYFQARVEQSESFYHLSYANSYYGVRVQSSRTVMQKRRFVNQYAHLDG
jgi:hypothetical protein